MSKKKLDALQAIADKFAVAAPETTVDGTVVAPRWETDIIMLDALLGGGFPKGKIVAIGSEEGVGKTTILLHSATNIITKHGKKVLYLDVEGGVTYSMMEGIGLLPHLYNKETNPDGLFYLMELESIQDINAVMQVVAADPEVALVIIDSTSNVINETDLDAEFMGADKNAVGSDARMWSANFKKINAQIKRSNACLVIVHQARNNLSGFHVTMGPSGGKAARHVATIEIWGMRREFIGEGDVTKDKTGTAIKRGDAIGARVQLTTTKNRLGMPFRAVDAFLYFGKGVSNKWAYRDLLSELQITDEATGEVRPVLQAGGWPSLQLPSGLYKGAEYRGNDGTWKLMEDHWDEIIEYIEANGGFITKVNNDLAERMAE